MKSHQKNQAKSKKSYSQYLLELNSFEHRWDSSRQYYYFFNPYTGETIIQQEGVLIDRNFSYWCPSEKICPTALITILLPQFYASRQWGRRKFYGFPDEDSAATCINSVVRGWFARQNLRRYYRENYIRVFDKYSGYYYFHYLREEREPAWFKPRLAFPDDILVPAVIDPEDYMHGEKLTYQGFTHGPYLRLVTAGKKNVNFANMPNFISKNEWRDTAVRYPSEIDLETCPLGSVIAWLDGLKAINYHMSDYAVMRTAGTTSDWKYILQIMSDHSSRDEIQLQGLHTFSKLEVPTDFSNRLTPAAKSVYEHCMSLLRTDNQNSIPDTRKVFALRVLYHILSVPAGRSEFINKDPPPDGTVYSETYSMKKIALNVQIIIRYSK